MRKVLNEEDAITRPFLVEYDRDNPAPEFTPDLIDYIESRQDGLSERDIGKLESIEWFVFNKHFRGMLAFDLPGIRESDVQKAAYIKRFSDEPYIAYMKRFMNYVPSDFPEDQVARFNQPSYRLTLPNGDRFYPIYYNGDFAAWRKRLDDNARYFGTSIGISRAASSSSRTVVSPRWPTWTFSNSDRVDTQTISERPRKRQRAPT